MRLDRPVDALPQCIARCAYGACLLLQSEIIWDRLGWLFSRGLTFGHRGLDLAPPPIWAIEPVWWTLHLSAVLIAIGLMVRPAAIVHGVLFIWWSLLDVQYHNNHYWFEFHLLLALSAVDTSGRFSFSSALKRLTRSDRAAAASRRHVPAWQLLLLQVRTRARTCRHTQGAHRCRHALTRM